MTTLRQKMKEEMHLVGLAASTQAIYLKAVTHLFEYYKRSPATLSEKEIREYLLHLKNKPLAPNTYNTHVYGLRFFYCITLRQPLRKLDLPTSKVHYKLPSILSVSDVQNIISATLHLKHRTLLAVIYGAGLRVSEAVALRIQDIDSQRMTLHIHSGKGGKDRYVILSPCLCQALRHYWKIYHFRDYLFPRQHASKKPLSISSAQQIFKAAKSTARINKVGGIHALRHAFATHALESGVDLFTIKTLLGHACIQSTARYLTFVPSRHKDLCLPIEQLTL